LEEIFEWDRKERLDQEIKPNCTIRSINNLNDRNWPNQNIKVNLEIGDEKIKLRKGKKRKP
jgi:hypothetical protein